MIQLWVLAEGQCEQKFVHDILAGHLTPLGVQPHGILVPTSHDKRRPDLSKRGGRVTWSALRRELRNLLVQHQGAHDWASCMFDYYQLPKDVPGRAEAERAATPLDAVRALEAAIATTIGDRRFIPYIQLHEFEALLLVQPKAMLEAFPGQDHGVAALTADLAGLAPEDVDLGIKTSPSHRIIDHFPAYARQKITASGAVIEAIGLPAIRAACPHFDDWLKRLERLAGG